MKRFIYIACLSLSLIGCISKPPRPVINYTGKVQGTTFNIIYDATDAGELNKLIDIIFLDIDRSLSLYDPTSLICRINRSDSMLVVDGYFQEVFEYSKTIYRKTSGAFNPAVYPLVQFWGFGTEKFEHPETIDSLRIDSLLRIINFDKVELYTALGGDGYYLKKQDRKMQLDFNGIAQGYTVDKICEMMDSKGIENYMVEVGGEVRAKGKNANGVKWRIGIDKPIEDPTQRKLMAIANIDESAVATSGSYRKYYEKNGIKYSHTIDPSTGYPVQHSMVSATVFAPTAAEADAYATAFMVMGVDLTRKFLEENEELEAYLIYTDYKGDWETWMSPGLSDHLEIMKENPH